MINANRNSAVGYRRRVAGGGGYSAVYQAIYDEFSTKPSDADATAQDTFVTAGVTDGWWSELDRLFILASHAGGVDALLDWIHPTGTGATAVNAPTFTQYQGYAGNATDKYINFNYNPSVNGDKWVVNSTNRLLSVSFGTYIRTNILTTNKYVYGSTTGIDCFMIMPSASLERIEVINELLTRTTTDIRGFYNCEAYANNPGVLTSFTANVYKNGVVFVDVESGVIGNNNNADHYGLCVESGGSPAAFTANELSLAYQGADLGATKQLAFYNAFQALMTHYGTQV